MTATPLSLSPRTVIFDYGEVISRRPSAADRNVIEQLTGVDPDKFWASYWAHRHALDLAVEGVREYWAAIAADTGADWDDGRICELWLADFRSWLSVNPATIDVLADLRAGGTRLALLSNAAPDYGSYFRHGILGEYFDAVYVSGELKLLKPGAEIYRNVLDDLGITASEAVFIDNRADNVRGAQELGITGHVFTDAATLRAFLESLAAASLFLIARPRHVRRAVLRDGQRAPGVTGQVVVLDRGAGAVVDEHRFIHVAVDPVAGPRPASPRPGAASGWPTRRRRGRRGSRNPPPSGALTSCSSRSRNWPSRTSSPKSPERT